jgi:hypothetical protein
MTDTNYTTEYEHAAYERGRRAAESAATHTEARNPAHLIAWIEMGHPSVDGMLPSKPNLSGEWGGSESSGSLVRSLVGEAMLTDEETYDAICEAWEAGVNDHWYQACIAELQRQIREAA